MRLKKQGGSVNSSVGGLEIIKANFEGHIEELKKERDALTKQLEEVKQ
jgi:hypothetical protein